MGCIVFLPGILGSELFLGDELVWPPTPIEAKFGYDRIDKLTDGGVKAGKPIGNVACFRFYSPIIDDLTEIATGRASAPIRRFHSFGYDWRIDLRDIAKDIAARLDKLPTEDATDIAIVAHSMGCLVSRLLLESGVYDTRPWFKSVKSLTAIAGPHLGAPKALLHVLGLEGELGLAPADLKSVGADPRYPSMYQLLPAPSVASVWNTRGGAMSRVSPYDPAVAATLGLDPVNLQKAVDVHGILAKGNRPPNVEYVYLAGSNKDTILRIDLSGARPTPRTGKRAGDGTVPLWSAVDPGVVHHIAPGPHDSIFRTDQIRELIYRALGARLPATPFSSGDGKPLIALLPGQVVYAQGAPIELMIVPRQPVKTLSGSLVVDYNEGSSGAPFMAFSRLPLSYDGVEAEQLNVRLEPPGKAGFYRATFEGSHATAEDGAAMFGVSDADGGSRG